MLKRRIMLPPVHLYPADEWRIVEARYSDEFVGLTETVFSLGNGFVGVRGSFEEGRPALVPGTFVNGFHETWPIVHAEGAPALAKTGQTIVNVPDNDHQAVRGRRAVLPADRAPAGLRADPHLVAMTYEVTMLDAAAPVVVSSLVLNRQDAGQAVDLPEYRPGDPRLATVLPHRVLNVRAAELAGHASCLATRPPAAG